MWASYIQVFLVSIQLHVPLTVCQTTQELCGHPPRSPEIRNYSGVQHWLALSPSALITGHQQCCHGLLPSVFIWQWSSESVPLFQSQRNFFPPTLWRWAAPETGQPHASVTLCARAWTLVPLLLLFHFS